MMPCGRAISNRDLNATELARREVALESLPTKLMVVLTRECNLRCIMCPRCLDRPLTLPYALAVKATELLPGLEKIDWQGGEVFLLDYFKKLFAMTADHPHILQHITTNGLLIDQQWAELFSRSKVDLLISIDSVVAATYESIRVNGRFADLLRALDRLNGARVKNPGDLHLDLIAIVMKRNYREVELLPDFCLRHGFRSLLLDLLWPAVAPQEDILTPPDQLAVEFLRRALPRMERDCAEQGIQFNCTFRQHLEVAPAGWDSDAGESAVAPRVLRVVEPTWDCSAPWNSLHVEPDGHVYPDCKCSRAVGDLCKSSLKKIWNGGEMRQYRSLLRAGQARQICSEQCGLYASLSRRDGQ